MQVVFTHECKSCQISNQINVFQCNVFNFENKGRTGYDINIPKKTIHWYYFSRCL